MGAVLQKCLMIVSSSSPKLDEAAAVMVEG